MIDPESRSKLAQALRHYASGLITNWQLDDVEGKRDDAGVEAIKGMAWLYYDDNHKHFASGKHALTREEKREFCRWILFLHSGLEYKWPDFNFYSGGEDPILNFLTFGKYNRHQNRKMEEEWAAFAACGDFSVWPFSTKEEFDSANRRPPFLIKSPKTYFDEND